MTRIRQQRHSEEIRERILVISRKIIAEKGPEALSIRQIAKEMDYSPGIIYHYFENKEEIILHVLREDYQKILSAVKPPDESLPPDEGIGGAIRGYIKSALQYPLEYKAIMLSASADILAFTSVLEEGISEKRPAFLQLVLAIEAGVALGLFAACDAELTAQAIWAAMFGLLTRIIVESSISQAQQTKLIDRQIEIILKGIRV